MAKKELPNKAGQQKVRVRLAPSPTGGLHIGTARTALFNWLFAKKHSGDFILRIEDTDRARSTQEFERAILEDLRWLGLDWAEGVDVAGDSKDLGKVGPYRQLERQEAGIYKPYLEKLLQSGAAYYCYCSVEELERDRKLMLESKKAPVYVGRCCNLTTAECDAHVQAGRSPVIRFKVPRIEIRYTDIVRGDVRFHGDDFGDFIIAKTDGDPLFLFANIIDDALMRITHVIRGEDHVPNVPKQILLAKALDLPIPLYGHLPLILNPDRSKMSKRAGPTHIGEYRRLGYLPEAIINYIALLGWNPGTTQELFTREELTAAFDLPEINKAGAVFDLRRLQWMNAQYLKKLSEADLIRRARDYIPKAATKITDEFLGRVMTTVRDRIRYLAELPELAEFYFADDVTVDPQMLVWKKSTPKESLAALSATLEAVEKIEDFGSPQTIEAALKDFAKTSGRSVGEVFWPLRVALTGKEFSPGPQEVLWVLGKEKGLDRAKKALTVASSAF